MVLHDLVAALHRIGDIWESEIRRQKESAARSDALMAEQNTALKVLIETNDAHMAQLVKELRGEDEGSIQ
jgi:hypothetical protein